jgi:hypothetical protein
MKADIKKIYEAHVAFELEQFAGKNLKANIKEEVDAAWTFMEKTKLNDISSAQKVKDFLERNLKDRTLTKHQKEYLIDLGEAIHQLALKSTHTLSDFISKETYTEISEYLIEQKEAREEIIERIVKNPFYGEMLADTLYDGIKSFMAQSGPTNETVGGSIFNLGKSLVGAALSGVQDNIDKNIKKFISTNLSKAIEDSEENLKERLSDAKLRMTAKTIWSKAEEIKIKNLAKNIKTSHILRIVEGGEKVSKDLIGADAVKELTHFIIDHFFEYDGDKNIATILKDNGIDKKIILKETEEIAIPIIQSMQKSGYLQERIEQRLSKFYTTL